jgi:ketosteroid isomerase-like protein
MKKVAAFLFLLFSISCNQQSSIPQIKIVNTDSIKQVLVQTDLDFSNLSKSIGQQKSFLEYMDNNVTMLQPGSMPLVGKDTMQKRYKLKSDTSFVLTWAPLFADVSSSGDLGYTYGTWKYQPNIGDSAEGTYCTIWKVDSGGNWKFVLDTGNDGLK